MSIDTAYHALFTIALIILAVLMGVCFVRSVIGPRITDRILSVNMISTMVICAIAILSRSIGEGYLVDVALIYALISFVSVLIFAMVYIPAHKRRDEFFRKGEKKAQEREDTSVRRLREKRKEKQE